MERAQFEPAELAVLLREVKAVLAAKIPGDFVEMGCYKGDTSVQIGKMLDNNRRLFVYDSFAGLPDKLSQDNSPAGVQFVAGELPASKQDVIVRLKKAGLNNVLVRKAWFSELESEDLPDQIALAFLDGDFHSSIMDSLRLVWPKLVPGALVVVDDYQNEALPGAAKAVDEWLRQRPAKLKVEKSLAIIKVQ